MLLMELNRADIMADGENDYLKQFGKNLERIKHEKQLSYRKIAQNCNVEHSDIKRYVDGKINPTLLSLVEIAKGLGVHPKDLLDF